MLSKFSTPNRFGESTWEIKINSLFRILIEDTGREYVVSFQEFIWLSRKNRFSFTSNQNFDKTIIDAFDKVYKYFLQKPKYRWTIDQKEKMLQNVLRLIDKSDYRVGPEPTLKMLKRYEKVVSFWIKHIPDVEIDERNNELEFVFYSEDKTSKTIYNINETDDLIIINYLQTNKMGKFPMKRSYPIGFDQNIILDDYLSYYKNLIFEIQQKKMDDLLVDLYK